MSAVKGALMYASCDQVALENLLPRIASSWANEHGCIWALVYTPSECVLTRVTNDGKLEPMPGTDGADDRAVTAAYEARVFSRQGEVRWQAAGGGVFRAVCIYDEGAPPDGFASP